jgi:acyl-coenzyme A thioesterase PaaI-like protein
MRELPAAEDESKRWPRTDTGVPLCGGCERARQCRLGLTREWLEPSGVAITELMCSTEYEGGPGVAHGGWIAAIFDEVLGHVPVLNDGLAVTGELTVRFIKPVPLERQLRARAWIDRIDGVKWFINGELHLESSGASLARASAIYISREKSKHFPDFQSWLTQQ